MLRTILVEDKFANLELLEEMLKPYDNQISIIAKAQTLVDAVRLIRELEPDLVFLDIHLPDGDGFELLNRTLEQKFEVVFTTAYSEYSLKAFDIGAQHYLLKPIDEDALDKAVNRCLSNQKANEKVVASEFLMQSFNNKKGIKKLMIPSHTKISLIDLNEVLYLEANRGYTQFHLLNGQNILSSKPIGVYEKQLEFSSFSRIHDKHIINLKYVTSYIKGRGGEVVLSNHTSLQVAARRKSEFMNKLSNFINEV